MQQRRIEIWNTKQCAEFLGVSEATVHRWRYERSLPHRQLGKVVRYVSAEVEEWFLAVESGQETTS